MNGRLLRVPTASQALLRVRDAAITYRVVDRHEPTSQVARSVGLSRQRVWQIAARERSRRRHPSSRSSRPRRVLCAHEHHDARHRDDTLNKARAACPACGGTWVDFGWEKQ